MQRRSAHGQVVQDSGEGHRQLRSDLLGPDRALPDHRGGGDLRSALTHVARRPRTRERRGALAIVLRVPQQPSTLCPRACSEPVGEASCSSDRRPQPCRSVQADCRPQPRCGGVARRLDVQVNEEKSRTVDLSREEGFGFLGFDFRRVRSLRGRWRPQSRRGARRARPCCGSSRRCPGAASPNQWSD